MPTKKFEKKYEEIKKDNTHGAGYLVEKTLQALKEENERKKLTKKEWEKLLGKFEKIHQGITALQTIITKIKKETEQQKEVTKKTIKESIEKAEKEIRKKKKKTIEKTAEEISKQKKIMTLSASTTIYKALEKIPEKERENITIYMLESRPMFEGKTQAEKIAGLGYKTRLIADAAMGYFANEVHAMIVGADTLYTDGAIVNKIGSLPLALVAKYYEKPYIVATTTLKEKEKTEKKPRKEIREKPPEEILKETKKDQLEARNIYFDYIPKELITKIITEKKR
ncbi:MAG: hypothetical protein U9O98_10205 [Asgard group archaeon]|nr:hypothetical protein [Asgard group archaeon]